MVYVLNKNGQPLMPTSNNAKVRILLKQNKAKIIRYCPFTIQLLYETTNYTQQISLGIDPGSKHIGISATSCNKVYFESEILLRNNIVNLIANKKLYRRSRRNRKTRYRKSRYINRKKKKGWLAPSIRQKIETHLAVVRKVCCILPISKIIIEIASFDIQRIKNPNIKNEEYQQGEQLEFWNVREYILWRDGYTCQCCKGKSKDKVLNVHHIESRKTGGNAPNNLITLCETCHKKFHKNEIKLPNTIKRGMKFNDETFMNFSKESLFNTLKALYKDVYITHGYITKYIRIRNNLPKTHYIDARCISGNPLAKSDGIIFYQRKIRCHNRQIHEGKFLKSGLRKKSQAPKYVKGYKMFDMVKYKCKEYTIFGRRMTGYFDIRAMDGLKVNSGGTSYKKIKLLTRQTGFIIERRKENVLSFCN